MGRIRSAPLPPRLLRYAFVVIFLVTITLWLRSSFFLRDSKSSLTQLRTSHAPVPLESLPPPDGPHPVDKLVREAQATFSQWVQKETFTLEDAAKAYRTRRGRHPPPGFKEWHDFAVEHKAVMVEDLFDQIYDDIEPFWGVDPAAIRKEAASFEETIKIRDHKAMTTSTWFWTLIWLDLFRTMEHLLPDMDIALNPMDEPRLVVPWEEMSTLMKNAAKTRKMPAAGAVVDSFNQNLPFEQHDVEKDRPEIEKSWEREYPYWPIVTRGCPPDSLARKAPVQKDFSGRPFFQYDYTKAHSQSGFVSNYTLSVSPCHQPDLQALQGIFLEPLTLATTRVLFPLFGGSKLSINNEILVPAAMYWQDNSYYTGGENHGSAWDKKYDAVVWRGVASGGRHKPDNWRGFQRHRFVSMNNNTQVRIAEEAVKSGKTENEARSQPNWMLPDPNGPYATVAQKHGRLADWVGEWSDAGFTQLLCLEGTNCDYIKPYFKTRDSIDMAYQFDYKYLPDIDGNSFSGRYLAFLRSTSLPIKSTLFREWHDSRLLPWKHFVPMDSRYGDWFKIMEYLLGYDDNIEGHDKVAERIATDGKQWAEMVLRKEDMQIYTMRLLLEYGRVSSDQRDVLGWVGDL